METKTKPLLAEFRTKLLKALSHLEYSYQKIEKLSSVVETLSLEELEHWESFSARFSRAADYFLSKYLRSAILYSDPGFRGTFRDLVNQAEKLGIIEEANTWLMIRELRNISAHEYEEDKLSRHFESMRHHCSSLLQLKDKLKSS